MSVSAVKIIQPGEIHGMPDDDTPLLVIADATSLFQNRAARLEHLAKEQGDSAWLKFCAQLTRAQLACVAAVPLTGVADNMARESLKHHVPPLSISSWVPRQDWDMVFAALCNALQHVDLPAAVRLALVQLSNLSAQEQLKQAHALLAAEDAQVSPEYAPFLGAALQLIWTVNAKQFASLATLHQGESGLCPICGSHPVASTVHAGDRAGHRYLDCCLCATQWYGPRARCTNCDTPKEVSMFGRSRDDAVQGECCDDCRGYLKLMLEPKDPQVEAMADDLATLNLDLALAEEGFQRTGRNLFFVTGTQAERKTITQVDLEKLSS
jgi:FdhE protein